MDSSIPSSTPVGKPNRRMHQRKKAVGRQYPPLSLSNTLTDIPEASTGSNVIGGRSPSCFELLDRIQEIVADTVTMIGMDAEKDHLYGALENIEDNLDIMGDA